MTMFRRSHADADIDSELRSHIEHRVDDLISAGVTRANAERQARIEFGGLLRFREASREAAGLAFFDSLVQDVRVSVRGLRKAAGFTATAVLTLALGIGANAIVFSVLNAFILRPLDVPDAESLYQLERGPDKDGPQSYPDYRDLRDRNHSFDDLAAYDIEQAGFDIGDGNPARVWLEIVTANYFDALRVQPVLGRVFHSADDRMRSFTPIRPWSDAWSD